jgi:thioredoxin reductase
MTVQAGEYDLVVIGAGIAGLNALYAATDYLARGARVLLIDQKDAAGGMWNTVYDYVRLHQPHPMFTVGDLPWDWDKPREYLATGAEVQRHLASSLGPTGERVALETRFGHTVSACREVETGDGPRAEVTMHPNGTPGEVQTLRARRTIHAAGVNYRPADPLPLASERVVSVIPQDLRATLAAHPGVPVYVVGGGKTGMDTVLATLAQDSGRRITLLNGRGTIFMNRTKYLPVGLKRWTGGEPVSRVLRDMALSFDGENDDAVLERFRARYSSDPQSRNELYLYGLQSEDEMARVRDGVSAEIRDYLAGVEDAAEGPRMVLRGGKALQVPAGSIFVNCTGSYFRAETLAEERSVLTPGNCVLSITTRDGFHPLTSVSGFFLTHLWYRGLLRGRGFYTADFEGLFRKNRKAIVGGAAAMATMNQLLALQTLPLSLLGRCWLDLDRWYPLPRRVVGLMRMKSTAKADIDHCRRALDRMALRCGVHCAPLT